MIMQCNSLHAITIAKGNRTGRKIYATIAMEAFSSSIGVPSTVKVKSLVSQA